MNIPRLNPTPVLLALGLAAFAVAGLSVADMFLPHPYDGLVLAEDHGGGPLVVREVIPSSAADEAGIAVGDRILGIGRFRVNDVGGAGEAVARFRAGDTIPYLVRKPSQKVAEVGVHLGRRHFGDGGYVYVSFLGFSFFFVGLFVLLRQPNLPVSQVFYLLCLFFLLFLACRMRPPSYSLIDSAVLTVGTIAFLLLPAVFLHFYLIFPRPALGVEIVNRVPGTARVFRWGWPLLYLGPPLVFGLSFFLTSLKRHEVGLIHGAPAANWWLLVVYMGLGLVALAANVRYLGDPRERRGVGLVLVGSLFGVVPFLVSSLVFQAALHSRTFFLTGIAPLVLVPITFAYAVVRFQLLNIRVILRRSLLYTVTTAVVTTLYAACIATFDALFRDTTVAATRFFPIILALAIVLLFEPLRRRLQELIDRYFFAERHELQRAMVDLGQALSARLELQPVVEELVERLPQILGLDFAALYLFRGSQLQRVAGPARLPLQLTAFAQVQQRLHDRQSLTGIERLATLALSSAEVGRQVRQLADAGVKTIGDLSSPRRPIGLVLLSGKLGQLPLEREERELLEGLFNQVALALETSMLLEERTHQAELERELEIAATIQEQLLPESLTFAPGWQVAAVCRPASIVGGDFFAQLPGPNGGGTAVVYGDVAGKSVSGALMMMAAHEVLHALALAEPRPAELFKLTNQRVYRLGKRNFVALGYFGVRGDRRLTYLVAGQPPPLLRQADGSVRELEMPHHRIPVGALLLGEYEALDVELEDGDLVLGYSDGVTDTLSPDGERFGGERLEEALALASGGPEEVIEQVLAAIEAFTQEAMQYDDLTLVAVGRRGEPER